MEAALSRCVRHFEPYARWQEFMRGPQNLCALDEKYARHAELMRGKKDLRAFQKVYARTAETAAQKKAARSIGLPTYQ